MQLPLRHRPQYKTEWMFEFIKTLNNFLGYLGIYIHDVVNIVHHKLTAQ